MCIFTFSQPITINNVKNYLFCKIAVKFCVRSPALAEKWNCGWLSCFVVNATYLWFPVFLAAA